MMYDLKDLYSIYTGSRNFIKIWNLGPPVVNTQQQYKNVSTEFAKIVR